MGEKGRKDIFSSWFVAVSARFWGAAAYSVDVAVAPIAVPEAWNMQQTGQYAARGNEEKCFTQSIVMLLSNSTEVLGQNSCHTVKDL
jgi:hypothetical protein